MPTYEYLCADCGGFEASRPISEAGAAQSCPACGGLSPRALASPHVRTGYAAIRYVAEARNEKSAHEPAIEHRLKGTTGHHRAHAHASHGHSHGRHSHRPWMIGH